VIVYVLTLFDDGDLMGDPEVFSQPAEASDRAMELLAYPNDAADFEGGPLWAILTDWNQQEPLEIEYSNIFIKIKPTEVV
jgi:hypothetical protein